MRGKQVDTKIGPIEALEYGGSPDRIEAGIDHQIATERVCLAFRLSHDPAASSQRMSEAMFHVGNPHDRRMMQDVVCHLMRDDERELVIILKP
ncbi:conserved hypothetical protein [Sphingomonas aurantiaca]|uniref:Uncharacterized protein n=1 Tax=Sphingomonas aurantiaca TaxID=185949 RepID=A0A5E7XNV8_9SPHN|nr:conserved hypothetical protein [Sphingomonas aurantiaca]